MREFLTAMFVPLAFLGVLAAIRQFLIILDMDVRLDPAGMEGRSEEAQKNLLTYLQVDLIQAKEEVQERLYAFLCLMVLFIVIPFLTPPWGLTLSAAAALFMSLIFLWMNGQTLEVFAHDMDPAIYD